jgi:DNA-binding LacI/PurR family transcriptional regulator
LPYSELVAPSLTTVNLSAHELGATAAGLLQDYIASGRPPDSRVLTTSLVVRESTGSAPQPAPRRAPRHAPASREADVP